MKFSHWVFDMDGTIVDSTLAYELYIRRIMAEFGITPTQEDLDRAYKYFNPAEYFATYPITTEQAT